MIGESSCSTIPAGTDALPYQWSCSALDTVRNGYFLPGLPYVDDPDGFVANNSIDFLPSATALLYIYPLPSSLNCSGTVSAVRYCYFDDNELGTERPIFTLLTLEQNGVFFNITYLTRVFSTPTAQICTGTSGSQYCCDSYTLRIMDQFHLPASNFAFGIIPASSVLLLGFNQVVNPEYVVEHYRETPSTFETGATIEVGSSVTDRALRLFQFFIGKYSIRYRVRGFILVHTVQWASCCGLDWWTVALLFILCKCT